MDYSYYQQPKADPRAGLSTAALVLSIIGVVFGFQVFGLVFSGLAIVFALLSRGDKERLEGRTKIAAALGALGVAIGIVAAVVVTYTSLKLLPQILHTQEFHDAMEQFYGEQTDEAISILEEQFPWVMQQE